MKSVDRGEERDGGGGGQNSLASLKNNPFTVLCFNLHVYSAHFDSPKRRTSTSSHDSFRTLRIAESCN